MRDFTEYTIDEDFSNTRLDRWFRQYFKGLSHNNLEKYLRKGFIKVNKKKIKSSYRLCKGDTIRISPFLNSFFSNNGESIKIYGSEDFIKRNTLYIDDDLLVINKPYNLAVQGGTGIKRHLDGLLLSAFSSKKITPRLVHRLDKETSGVMLIALNRKMASHLSNLFKNKDIYKTYWAITEGSPIKIRGEINFTIEDYEKKESYISLTKYNKVLEINDYLSWVVFRPVTGRTHQIRKHASMSNFPIVGDKKYGNKNQKLIKFNKLHLHSHSVDFKGLNGEILHFEAPLPEHMMETWIKYNLPLKLDNDCFIGD